MMKLVALSEIAEAQKTPTAEESAGFFSAPSRGRLFARRGVAAPLPRRCRFS